MRSIKRLCRLSVAITPLILFCQGAGASTSHGDLNNFDVVDHGVLSGTPTSVGTFNFTAEATDADNVVAGNSYVLTVNADIDSDSIDDSQDNCTDRPNSDQRDTDGDGYGNVCDADFNNDGVVNFVDLGMMKAAFFAAGDKDTDLNGDHVVNFADLGMLKSMFFAAPGPSCCGPSPPGTTDPVDPLVELGEALFFNETFGGNGRTCGTCHRAENNFTIDTAFIATLPPDDPLFVSETSPNLPGLEDSTMLREFGLIRANADGFENPTEKFVLRSVSHLFGLASTLQSNTAEAPLEMTGWSGDGAPGNGTLRDFSTGAVRQHFPRGLARVEGLDFRLPTEGELDALEAFMLTLGTPATLDLQVLRLTDPGAERGRELFITEDSENGTKSAAKCNACHRNAGALTVAGINQNFDTGIENALHPADALGALRPRDGGFGTALDASTGAFGNGTFNPPPLVNAADTAPYFHNNLAATLEEAIGHYESDTFRMSPEGQRLLLADSGGREMTVDVDALSAFLRVLNVLENVRSAVDHLSRARLYVTAAGLDSILNRSLYDLNDIERVLVEGGIHPEVIPFIDEARGHVDAALVEPLDNVSQRNSLIDLAIAALEAGRDLTVSVLPELDTQPPSVSITSPAAGVPVFNTITITVAATDASGVSNVIFQLGQTEIGQDASAPFEMVLDTRNFEDGENLLTVKAVDPGSNSATASLMLTIDNASVEPPPDTTDPTVLITAPADGSTVSGSFTIAADADDDTGVVNVVFSVDGTQIGQDTTSPYEQVWDSTSFPNGGHDVVATAFDAAGNSAYSDISVIVENITTPCTVYSCPNPPDPPSEPPPDQVIPPGSSPDGEFEGEVTAVDLQAFTVSVLSGGEVVTVKITAETEFMGSVAVSIVQVLIGHIAQGEFFSSTGEAVWIEADLPPGL